MSARPPRADAFPAFIKPGNADKIGNRESESELMRKFPKCHNLTSSLFNAAPQPSSSAPGPITGRAGGLCVPLVADRASPSRPLGRAARRAAPGPAASHAPPAALLSVARVRLQPGQCCGVIVRWRRASLFAR